ncbi:MAG TPA: CHC2 zinc finger domain-containing protein [Anaerolineales bacterium]|nr:CHC2 zinc finger domain-containing protein [Anaerolineales bacterium]
MSVNNLLNSLDRVRKMGADRWVACCPAHNDKSPSLAIRELSDGAVLLHCFAGCSAHEIVSAVGLDLSELFPEKSDFHVPRQKYPFSAREVLACLVPETFTVALIGNQMARGIRNDEKTQQALITAVSRISAAHSYVEGL